MNELKRIIINGDTYQLGDELSVDNGILKRGEEPITRLIPKGTIENGNLILNYAIDSVEEGEEVTNISSIDLNNVFQEDITYSTGAGITNAIATVPIKDSLNTNNDILLEIPIEARDNTNYYPYPSFNYNAENHTLTGYNYAESDPEKPVIQTIDLYGDNILKTYKVPFTNSFLDETNSEIKIVAGHFNTQIHMKLKFKTDGTPTPEINGDTILFTISDEKMRPFQPCMYWGVLKNETAGKKSYMCAIEIDVDGNARLSFINGLDSSFELGNGWGIYNVVGTYVAKGRLTQQDIDQAQIEWDTPDSDVTWFLEKVFEYIYPLNSVIIVDSNVDLRNTETRNNTEWRYLPGRWEKVEDRILYSPRELSENKEGGRWTNIPPHKHELISDVTTENPSTGSTAAVATSSNVLKKNGTITVGTSGRTINATKISAHTHKYPHTHIIKANSFKVEKTKRAEWDGTNNVWNFVDISENNGQLAPTDILPPYREVAIWIRTDREELDGSN